MLLLELRLVERAPLRPGLEPIEARREDPCSDGGGDAETARSVTGVSSGYVAVALGTMK